MGCDTNEVDLRKPDPIAALKSWLESDADKAGRLLATRYANDLNWSNGTDRDKHFREYTMNQACYEQDIWDAYDQATADARTLVRAAVAAYEAEIEHLKGWLEVYQDIATRENP